MTREQEKRVRFERLILVHLGASYNLARWLMKNDTDAQDVVQDSVVRAFTFFDKYRGGDARAWLLTIVRRTAYTHLRKSRVEELTETLDDDFRPLCPAGETALNPESILLRQDDEQRIRQAVELLPVPLREVIVLREMEDLSYKEIADLIEVPIGTVMSRLARARQRLRDQLLGGVGRGEKA